jgi:hypothetical protein
VGSVVVGDDFSGMVGLPAFCDFAGHATFLVVRRGSRG